MYKTSVLKSRAIELINTRKLVFVHDVFTLLGIAKSTFYEHFPNDSDDNKELMDLLQRNKAEIKVSLRSKWFKSENATLQIMLMKLVSTPEERKLMSQSFVDVVTEVKENESIDLSKLDEETLLKLKNIIPDNEQ